MQRPLHEEAPNRKSLCDLLCQHLEAKGWSFAELSKRSGVAKSTIGRLANYKLKTKIKRPAVETLYAIAIALGLNLDESRELFRAAYPIASVCEEAIEKGLSMDETNDLLYDMGLPTFDVSPKN